MIRRIAAGLIILIFLSIGCLSPEESGEEHGGAQEALESFHRRTEEGHGETG